MGKLQSQTQRKEKFIKTQIYEKKNYSPPTTKKIIGALIMDWQMLEDIILKINILKEWNKCFVRIKLCSLARKQKISRKTEGDKKYWRLNLHSENYTP